MQCKLFRCSVQLICLVAIALPLVAQCRIIRQGVLDEGNCQVSQLVGQNYLDSSRRGEVGLVYLDVEKSGNWYRHRLYYCGILPDGLPQPPQDLYDKKVHRQRIPMAWSLVFDADSQPHVLFQHNRNYFHFYRKDNQWQRRELRKILTKTLPPPISWITHYNAVLGQDSLIHVFLEVQNRSGQHTFLHGIWNQNWVFTEVERFPGEIFGVAVDCFGNIHLAYKHDRHLYYAKSRGKSWKPEPVSLRKNFDSEPAWKASLALDKSGQPFIASTHIQRASTGSFRFAQLRFHSRQTSGKWYSKVVVTKSAGYYGRDGKQYTGISPCLSIDDKGRSHILFTDMASWHNRQRNDYAIGQLRYCWRDKMGWRTQIVYKQIGQAQQVKPLYEFWYPSLTMSADGQKLYFAGIERTTSSAVNLYDPDAARYYRLLCIYASNGQ